MIIFSLSVGILYIYINIHIYIYIYIYIHILIRSALSHVNYFVCFFIYYMCDGSIASIASPIISLVTGKNEYEITALMKKASITFKQKICNNNNKTQYTVFLICNLNQVSMLRENAMYTIYLYLCPPLPLSKYIQWRAVNRGGAVRGCGRMLQPLPPFRTASDLCEILLENFPKYRSVGQSRFTKHVTVVNTCESDHF